MARTTYFVQVSATATRSTATFTTAATFENTPPDNSNVLYLGSVECLCSSGSQPHEVRLRDLTATTTRASYIAHQGAAVTSALSRTMSLWTVVPYGASPGAQSISLEVRSSASAINLQRSNAYLYGLVLSDNDQFVIGPDTFTSVTATVWSTVGLQLDVSVATSGGWLILSYAEASAGSQGISGASPKFRMMVDGSAGPSLPTGSEALAALPMHFIYAGRESFSAGAHTVNLQAAHGGGSTQNTKVRAVRHVALEISAFANSYISEMSAAVSGSAFTHTSVFSFTPDIAEEKKHMMLAYWAPGAGAVNDAADVPVRSRYLINSEDISQADLPSRIYGSANNLMFPCIVVTEATLAAGTNTNFTITQKIDNSGANFYSLNRGLFAILQLADASAGGGGNSTTPKTITAIGQAIPSITKQVGKRLDGRTTSIATHQKGRFLGLQAVTRSIATLGVSSAFRVTLNALTRSIATINVATIRGIYLAAVTNSVAQFTKRVGKNLHAVAGSLANFTKSVGKPLQAVTNSPATLAAQTVIVVPMEAVGRGVASMTEVYVTASTGTAPGSVPYVLHLGDSVKRFTSLIAYQFGIGKGTVSDRDPDT